MEAVPVGRLSANDCLVMHSRGGITAICNGAPQTECVLEIDLKVPPAKPSRLAGTYAATVTIPARLRMLFENQRLGRLESQ
jgi:hypothetical protein